MSSSTAVLPQQVNKLECLPGHDSCSWAQMTTRLAFMRTHLHGPTDRPFTARPITRLCTCMCVCTVLCSGIYVCMNPDLYGHAARLIVQHRRGPVSHLGHLHGSGLTALLSRALLTTGVMLLFHASLAGSGQSPPAHRAAQSQIRQCTLRLNALARSSDDFCLLLWLDWIPRAFHLHSLCRSARGPRWTGDI